MKLKCYFLFILVFCLLLSSACADGFSDNPEQINLAAKSVMKLEVLDKNGDIIKTGSGFVAFDNRHLITNYHVADEADMIYAYSDAGDPYIIMDVCISDSQKDIAVLQFFSPTDLSPLTLNETGEVIRASAVVAIGSPKGFANTISTGIVSSVFEENGCGYIQFTAPISSGSSGGALFNNDGKIIGITTMNYDDGVGANQNLNFAVNIKEAVELYADYDGNVHKLQDLMLSDVSAPEPDHDISSKSLRGIDEYIVTKQIMLLLEKPSNLSKFICSIPGGTRLKVLETLGQFTLVDYNGKEGYVATKLLYE